MVLSQLQVGPVKIGSEHPIALQTMTTTDTRNIQATVDQVRGCERSWSCINCLMMVMDAWV